MSDKYDITHDNLSFYLERRGWVKATSNRPSLDIYQEPGQEHPIEIPVPNKAFSTGYASLISDAIEILSNVEARPTGLVVRSINKIDHDLHDYRILTGTSDSVPVPLLHELIGSTRALIQDSNRYLQTIEKRATKGRKSADGRKSPREESLEFVRDCKFGHTWKGSFGITIETPLHMPTIGMFADIPETIGRKTTNRILSGYSILMESVRAQSYGYILDNISDRHQLLMFEGFPELADYLRHDEIDVAVELSPSIAADSKLLEISKAKINQSLLKNIDKAVEHLRNPVEEIDTIVIGFPETISATMEGLLHSLANEHGHVTVKGESAHVGRCALRMELSFDDYRKALLAQESVRPVRVICRIRKQVKGWEVLSVSSFELLDSGDSNDK